MTAQSELLLPQVLVLGRGMHLDNVPTTATRENAIAVAEYFRSVNGEVDKIVFSGGTSHMASERVSAGISEAEAMASIAEDEGVPASKVVLERDSGNTIENFTNSATILDQIGRTGVVTHRAQMRRILYVAKKVLVGSVYPIASEDYYGTAERGGIGGVWVPALKDRITLLGVQRGDLYKIKQRNEIWMSLAGGSSGAIKKHMGSREHYE